MTSKPIPVLPFEGDNASMTAATRGPSHRLCRRPTNECLRDEFSPLANYDLACPEKASHNEFMKIGYARVSTDEQNLDLQQDALKRAGCDRIFQDHGVSGMACQRPGLDEALASLKPGDILVVWKLDRLGRSLAHLIELIQKLRLRDCGFQSISEGMDTSTPAGWMLFQVIGSLAEFERALIVERTKAGLVAARKRGQALGRKPALSLAQIESARTLIKAGGSPTSVAKQLKVGRSTMYRSLALEPTA
jgi:DNA invertase Pin-like site-specific DNA recombinase